MTAIEFAILGMPFFTIIFAIIETAMVFFASQVLDSAVEDASRLVRTGQAQTANYQVANFRDAICRSTFGLFNCDNIVLKAAVVSDFASANSTPTTIQSCNTITCTWGFTSSFAGGTGRQVIKVEAYYRWPLIISFPWFNLKNQPDNYRLLGAVRVFRNEPFTSSSTTAGAGT